MNKISELASILVTKYELSQKDAESFVISMFDVIHERLQNNEKQVKIKGLGTFKLTSVSSRESVNVNTGERIVIEGRNKISFTPDTTLKERVNLPFSQFETVVINDGIDFSDLETEKESTEEKSELATESEQTNLIEQEIKPTDNTITIDTEDVPKCGEEDKQEVSNADNIISEVAPEPKIEDIKQNNDNSICETGHTADESDKDNINEDDDEERKNINKTLIIILVSIIVVQMAILGYGGYYFNEQLSIRDQQIQQLENSLNIVQNKLNRITRDVNTNLTVKQKHTQDIDTKSAQQNDTISNISPKVAKSKTESIKANAEYNKDPRIRTGAYVIEGIAQSVTVKKGETLSSLSRRYLGPGMECYMEAVNGKKEFKEGDKINIPQLRHKRSRKPNK